MRSRNSSRRLRFASVSRSTAWSDFFSAADPAVLTTAGPSTNSSLRRCRGRVVRVTRLPSDPDAPQPEWRSGRTLPELDGSSVRACSAPARAVRSPAAGGRSSPHTRDSRRTPPPASGNFHTPWRAPQISCAAGRPRRLSPSSSSPQSLASSTLPHHWYCFNVFLPVGYRFRCSRFDESAYAHEHTFSQTENALMHLRVAKLRGQPKWKNRL